MNKTLLIIQREYLSRVKNKTFLLTTLLTPLLFVFLIGFSTYLTVKSDSTLNIAVQDANGYFKSSLKNSKHIEYSFPTGIDSNNYLAKGYSALLIIPKFEGSQKTDYFIRYKKGIGPGTQNSIEDDINAAIEDHLLEVAGINQHALDSIRKQSRFAALKPHQEKDNNQTQSDSTVANIIGYVCGFLIYITMFIYGVMVMRGVTEEKTNRIAEVIISSVKPFQLMLGKIIGIGAVGLTQFLIWIILIVGLSIGASHFLSPDTLHQVQAAQQSTSMAGSQSGQLAQGFAEIQLKASGVNWILIVGLFLFYFIGGYLFYAALFAAAGSAVEDVQNSQSLTMPITMPIIFSFIILTKAINYPDSPVAVWASIIPFSSPIIMMARVAYGVPGTVPYWQLLLSMASLIAGFLFTTWLAGKIYRTGILLYGKKSTWKEMIKWAFVKN